MEQAGGLYTTPEMTEVFSPAAHVAAMLAFEAALARAQARVGLVPPLLAEHIAAGCRVELFDVTAIYAEAASAGTPAIPLIRRLIALVGDEAAAFVHLGATSQDAIDTATMLQLRAGIDLLIADLLALGRLCLPLVERYRVTPMVGRTLLQHAAPISFGLKAARWLASVTRQTRALLALRERALAVQLGGPVGTLAALGTSGPDVIAALAAELELAAPDLPWHAERERVADVAATLGILCGTMAKIAADLLLLRQTEIAEIAERLVAGKGGSSALPHKRNPVDATAAVAAARLGIGLVPVVLGAMVQEHERAAGGWQAEWDAIPRLFACTAAAVARVHAALTGIEVDTDRMRANLDVAGDFALSEALTTALTPGLGRATAFDLVRALVERARAAGTSLRHQAEADARVSAALTRETLIEAFDPANALGSAGPFVDRAVADFRALDASPGSS